MINHSLLKKAYIVSGLQRWLVVYWGYELANVDKLMTMLSQADFGGIELTVRPREGLRIYNLAA